MVAWIELNQIELTKSENIKFIIGYINADVSKDQGSRIKDPGSDCWIRKRFSPRRHFSAFFLDLRYWIKSCFLYIITECCYFSRPLLPFFRISFIFFARCIVFDFSYNMWILLIFCELSMEICRNFANMQRFWWEWYRKCSFS